MSLTPRQLFSTLAHPLRLRAVLLLQSQGELCVCELTHVLKTHQPMVSRHLAQLRKTGLVTSRRDGLWIHYRLASDLPEWATAVITAAADTERTHATDRHVLASMSRRPDHAC
ncbi:MAG: transcriptional regulator [Gammaproteobacteria bacterium]|nr:MAG: transcriptional regulator [Gammaproteobacteria bacterium]